LVKAFGTIRQSSALSADKLWVHDQGFELLKMLIHKTTILQMSEVFFVSRMWHFLVFHGRFLFFNPLKSKYSEGFFYYFCPIQ